MEPTSRIPRDHMDALREAITQDFPDVIAVMVLTGSAEQGELGMFTSSEKSEEETVSLFSYALLEHAKAEGWLPSDE